MKHSASKSHVHPHSGGCFRDSHAFIAEIIKIEIANAQGEGEAQGVFKDEVQHLKPAGILIYG